jgi:TusA-related sulfurtransferase
MDAFCQQTGHELLASEEREDAHVFLVRKA